MAFELMAHTFDSSKSEFIRQSIIWGSWKRDALRIATYIKIEQLIGKGKKGNLKIGEGFILNSLAKDHPFPYKMIQNEIFYQNKNRYFKTLIFCIYNKYRKSEETYIPYIKNDFFLSKLAWLIVGGNI